MKKINSVSWLIAALAIIKFLSPYLLQSAYYEPHRDEFLYLAEGRHMAWGFMEVPPLLSVFAWLTNAFGGSMFWIKCWPSLFGALTFIVIAQTIRSLGGKAFAILLAFLPFITGSYLRLHFLFQPNFLEVFFWTTIAWSMVSFVQTNQVKWLYVFGLSVGLGMLSKYSVAFFTVAVLAGLLLTPHRKIFSNKHFYLAALLAFIIFLPNVLWQYHNQFPVFFHMKELRETQLQYISPSGFLVSQLVMNFSCMFIWIAGLIAVLFARALRPYQFIGIAYITIIAILLAGHGKDYYALGVYPILFAFGGYQLEQLTTTRFKILRYVFILIPAVLAYVIVPVLLPVFEPGRLAAFYRTHETAKTGSLKWEDLENHPLPQDFADMLGWKEMAKKTGIAYHSLDSNEQKNTLLFCDNYGQAGAVNYYRNLYHIPETYSDNASFLYWMPVDMHFENIVLVTDDEHEMNHSFIKNFRSAVVSDSITAPYSRERGSLIIILKGADDTFKKFFLDKLAKDRAKVSGQGETNPQSLNH